jgi:pimeloyl-ACP methyl ester carboxylesterase
MDYNRPLTDSKYNPKVHIALVLAPGAHNGAKKFSTSPLLLNPGGPGGSGTTFALLAAGMLQKMIDPEQDIIGFDPRGVGATTPRADCFAYPSQGTNPGGDYSDEDYVTGSYNRMMWENAGLEVGAVNSSSNSLLQLDVRARTIARLCQEKDDAHGKNSILKYVHTPSVARDMISIIDAWDKWRDAMNQESSPCHDSKTTASAEPEDAISNSTKGKLVYWGFSYGVSCCLLIIKFIG